MITGEVRLFLASKRGSPLDLLSLPESAVLALNVLDTQFAHTCKEEAKRA